MRSANGISYQNLLALFEAGENIDETAFLFTDDPKGEGEHYIGYIPYAPFSEEPYEEPYWAGYCDIQDGCEYATAKELFEAPIYHGKSLKERWREADIYQIGGFDALEYMKMYPDKFS